MLIKSKMSRFFRIFCLIERFFSMLIGIAGKNKNSHLFKRESISSQYIGGLGIEIGALCNPFNVPDGVDVLYVDRYNSKKLRQEYPELKTLKIINPDIISDAESLRSIKTGSLNFVIASHVLEHMSNPIGALINWIDILKENGILVLVVPHYDNDLDKGREIIEFEHLINDSMSAIRSEDFIHYKDIIKYWQKCDDINEIEKKAKELFSNKYSIHFHVFDMELLDNIIQYLINEKNIKIQIVRKDDLAVEFIYIIQKI